MAKKKKIAVRYAGVDIGGTKLYAVITNAKGKVLGKARCKTGGKGFKKAMSLVRDLVAEACASADVDLATLRAVGVGAPSPVLPDGTAVRAPNLGWEMVPLTARLQAALDRPVFAINDCNAGTLGEHVFGAGKKATALVGLFMGTGLGGGIVLDGRLITGANHQAAELGHAIIVKDGRRCGCGNRGCLEAYASKTGMGRRITHEVLCEDRQTLLTELCGGHHYGNIRSGLLRRAYEAGDDLTLETLHEAAAFLGQGVGSLITLLGPDMVVLGGGVLEALGEALLPRIKASAKAVTFPSSSFDDTRIRLAALGDDAVALGAVAWAIQQSTNTTG